MKKICILLVAMFIASTVSAQFLDNPKGNGAVTLNSDWGIASISGLPPYIFPTGKMYYDIQVNTNTNQNLTWHLWTSDVYFNGQYPPVTFHDSGCRFIDEYGQEMWNVSGRGNKTVRMVFYPTWNTLVSFTVNLGSIYGNPDSLYAKYSLNQASTNKP